jgi:hypothetical protein
MVYLVMASKFAVEGDESYFLTARSHIKIIPAFIRKVPGSGI